MKTAVLCFSHTGWQTGERLCRELKKSGGTVTLEGKSRYLSESIACSTQEWAAARFADSEQIIFIGACGIAVRSIAPYVKSKKSDPAVLVIDECGRYVIPLLSGHLGGANELAEQAAALLNAVPVITTATDLHQTFAVDMFAKNNHCRIRNMQAAKEVSAALLAGKTAGFYSEFQWEGTLPEGLKLCEGKEGDADVPKIGVAVTIHEHCLPFPVTVQIIPRVVTLGMGCKKGKEPEAVRQAAEAFLVDADLCREAVTLLASIDLKKEEACFQSLSKEWDVPFATYTAEELERVKGEFTPSAFVKSITGTDNVCERSAVCGSGSGRLIQKKTGGNGVTAAAAIKEWRVYFE